MKHFNALALSYMGGFLSFLRKIVEDNPLTGTQRVKEYYKNISDNIILTISLLIHKSTVGDYSKNKI